MNTLRGRCCLFAGGTGNVGEKAVDWLTAEGMNVCLLTHNPASANALQEKYRDHPGKIEIYSKMTQEEACHRAYEQFGSVDVIISKTGLLEAPVSLEEIDGEKLKKDFDNQVVSVLSLIKTALPYLRKSRAGRVILCNSLGAMNGTSRENIIGSITRGAVSSMMYSLVEPLAKDNVTINCITVSSLLPDHEGMGLNVRDFVNEIPLGRIGSSQDFASAVCYLASEEAGFVSGQIIKLTGGEGVGL